MGQERGELAKLCLFLVIFMYLYLISHFHEEKCRGVSFSVLEIPRIPNLPDSKKLDQLLEFSLLVSSEPRQKPTSVSRTHAFFWDSPLLKFKRLVKNKLNTLGKVVNVA